MLQSVKVDKGKLETKTKDVQKKGLRWFEQLMKGSEA